MRVTDRPVRTARSAVVDVESYSTTLPSTFVITFCDDPDETSEDASQSG